VVQKLGPCCLIDLHIESWKQAKAGQRLIIILEILLKGLETTWRLDNNNDKTHTQQKFGYKILASQVKDDDNDGMVRNVK